MRRRRGGAGVRSSPRRGRRPRARRRLRAQPPPAPARRTGPRARRGLLREHAGRGRPRSLARREGRPRATWSPAPVPHSGAMNESTAACRARTAAAAKNGARRDKSWGAAASSRRAAARPRAHGHLGRLIASPPRASPVGGTLEPTLSPLRSHAIAGIPDRPVSNYRSGAGSCGWPGRARPRSDLHPGWHSGWNPGLKSPLRDSPRVAPDPRRVPAMQNDRIAAVHGSRRRGRRTDRRRPAGCGRKPGSGPSRR